MAVRRLNVKGALTGILLVVASVIPTSQVSQIRPMERRDTGQNVAPIFEGWTPNSDGTFSLYFGYLNRNYVEEPDIAVGPNNVVEPGGPDRGQPTHFLPRKQSEVFKVVVPKDFGNKKVTWTLSIRGATASVSGSLNPQFEINVDRATTTGNTPPVVTVGPDQTITLPATATLAVAVTDETPKPRRRSSRPRQPEDPSAGLADVYNDVDRRTRLGVNEDLTVEWSKYRGPGDVTFSPATQPVVEGKATTKARFSAPGVYTIRIVADDGTRHGGFYCCWTNAEIKVTVNPASRTPGQR